MYTLTHQAIIESEYANVATVMNVITSHHRIGKIFHPNTGQGITTNFVVFVRALSIVCHIKSYIFAVANVAVSDSRICVESIYAKRRSD